MVLFKQIGNDNPRINYYLNYRTIQNHIQDHEKLMAARLIMLKKTAVLFFFSSIFMCYSCIGMVKDNKSKMCFDKENFDKVYAFIKAQTTENQTKFYKYENTEIYLNNSIEITFKKDGYTFSKINREAGLISLAKNQNDNTKILQRTNQLFCQLLSETIK